MKVVAVSGVPGTGKTTLSRKLSKKLNFYYLDVNKLISNNKLYEGYDKKRKTKIVKEDWKSNGNLVAIFEIPAGIQEEIENDLNKLTKGDVDIKILNKK